MDSKLYVCGHLLGCVHLNCTGCCLARLQGGNRQTGRERMGFSRKIIRDARSLTRVLFPRASEAHHFSRNQEQLASNLTKLPLNTRGGEREKAKERRGAPGADGGL